MFRKLHGILKDVAEKKRILHALPVFVLRTEIGLPDLDLGLNPASVLVLPGLI